MVLQYQKIVSSSFSFMILIDSDTTTSSTYVIPVGFEVEPIFSKLITKSVSHDQLWLHSQWQACHLYPYWLTAGPLFHWLHPLTSANSRTLPVGELRSQCVILIVWV